MFWTTCHSSSSPVWVRESCLHMSTIQCHTYGNRSPCGSGWQGSTERVRQINSEMMLHSVLFVINPCRKPSSILFMFLFVRFRWMKDIDFASLNDTSGVVSAWVHGAPQGVPWQCLVCVGHVGNALVVTNTQIRSKECFAGWQSFSFFVLLVAS